MKKTYDKPPLMRAGMLSQTVAAPKGITGYGGNGTENGADA